MSQHQLCKKFDDDHKGPINVLIHLTTTQHKRMAQNCIHVTKKYRKENKVYYSNMVFGDNIRKRRQKACEMGKTVVWSEILMNNIKNGVVYITTAVDELSEEIQNGTIHLVDGTSTCTTGSGVVILMMCKLGEKDNCTGKEWGRDDHVLFKKIKVSTNSASHKHHGSIGDYYCFGNKALYGKVGTSSVSQYALKRVQDIVMNWH